MLDLFDIAKPQGCDIQTFYGSGITSGINRSWSKPRGISNIYMLLIGAGGSGDGTTGGGSGAVTVWYGSAQNVPDNLIITVGNAGTSSTVSYRTTQSTTYSLLSGNSALNTIGGTAMTANQFAASGFFQSIAGQSGSSAGITASGTTFLSGGGSAASSFTANYGYTLPTSVSASGFFYLQPIIVSLGGKGNGKGSLGSGGGAASGPGGQGMVLIASW